MAEAFAARGSHVVRLGDEMGMPDLVILDPVVGLVASELVTTHEEGDPTPFRALNAKMQTLKEWLELGPEVKLGRFVIDLGSTAEEPVVGRAGRTVISPVVVARDAVLDLVEPNPLGDLFPVVAQALLPTFAFKSATRSGADDAGIGSREAARLVLDAHQVRAAQQDIGDLGVVTGPPGSGKTLVLAGRARWLAERHRTWDIRVLCYNRALVPYLMELLSGLPNVRVQRIAEFAKDMQVKFSFTDDAVTADGIRRADGLDHRPTVEAVLIDEAQDFRPIWLELIRSSVSPGGGGVLLAGDSAQALYHDGAGLDLTSLEGATRIRLERPYRSTRRIMRAVGDLDPEFEVSASAHAPDGEPVELIWAESWDQQAECVGWEIAQMIESGQRTAGDIGVLVTTKWGTFKRLSEVFERREIPFTIVSKENSDLFDRGDNTVKIMTVHSAKGHEFPVVFVFALEALPNIDPSDTTTRTRARVGFVGGTRAKDQLLITYTRDNEFLKKLSTNDDDVRRWVWPDSYEGDLDG